MAKKTSFNLRNVVEDIAEQALDEIEALTEQLQPEEVGNKPEPVQKRVSLIIHNPRVPSRGNKKLNELLRWNDPDRLTERIITDLRKASYGYANYKVVERIEVDKFPQKVDGFAYTGDSFVKAWEAKRGFHDPDAVDYNALLAEFDMIKKVEQNKVDEFWLYAFPYAGYYESIMAGDGAFWCNAPALKQTSHCKKRFIIMGFNYQRGVGEALEAYGHRFESIMRHVFRRHKGKSSNLWERFARYDQTHPGKAEVGIMHFAPNSEKDYDWGNKRKVQSTCDNWLNFPDLSGAPRTVDCRDWGDGDTRAHHMWWFERVPHITGHANGISYNWWQYVVDPNTVR